jgi:hypothetical protein
MNVIGENILRLTLLFGDKFQFLETRRPSVGFGLTCKFPKAQVPLKCNMGRRISEGEEGIQIA